MVCSEMMLTDLRLTDNPVARIVDNMTALVLTQAFRCEDKLTYKAIYGSGVWVMWDQLLKVRRTAQ